MQFYLLLSAKWKSHKNRKRARERHIKNIYRNLYFDDKSVLINVKIGL